MSVRILIDQDITPKAPLFDAFESGRIAGASLDVYYDEPLSADSQLHNLDNGVTMPHIATASILARTRIAETLAGCIRRLHDGDRSRSGLSRPNWKSTGSRND